MALSASAREGKPVAALHNRLTDGVTTPLPGATRSEGVLESASDGHRPVTGPTPGRPRTDHDPPDRREYLLRTVRRVAG